MIRLRRRSVEGQTMAHGKDYGPERDIPDAWHVLERTNPVRPPRKRQITLRLDEDMIAFYRAFGRGYQGRINAVLRCYMQAIKSNEIAGPERRDGHGAG
ncbi:MAG: BrnA antitoxin family protein [Pseudomonadota bacterium]